jgi:hypothetical protein
MAHKMRGFIVELILSQSLDVGGRVIHQDVGQFFECADGYTVVGDPPDLVEWRHMSPLPPPEVHDAERQEHIMSHTPASLIRSIRRAEVELSGEIQFMCFRMEKVPHKILWEEERVMITPGPKP